MCISCSLPLVLKSDIILLVERFFAVHRMMASGSWHTTEVAYFNCCASEGSYSRFCIVSQYTCLCSKRACIFLRFLIPFFGKKKNPRHNKIIVCYEKCWQSVLLLTLRDYFMKVSIHIINGVNIQMDLFSLCLSIAMAMKSSINVCFNIKHFSALFTIHYLAAIIKKKSCSH